jgi:adenosylhomocysteine nucleosidase
MKLGLITGMLDEASCLDDIPKDARPSIRCSGAVSANAYAHAKDLISDNCDGLISFGMAGGLSPDLEPGDIVISSSVISKNGTWNANISWADALVEILIPEIKIVSRGRVFGSDRAITTPAEKAQHAENFDAAIVDMESHAVARAAEEAGAKFIIVRVVTDTYDRAIPNWVTNGIREDGSVNKPAMALGTLIHPWHIPALGRLASDSNKAKESLRRVALLVGPSFSLGTLR